MNRMQPMRFYVGLLGFFMAALIAGTFYFLIGMTDNSYVISDGVRLGMQYVNKPRYDANVQGVIYTVCFLVAGGLLLLLVILPDGTEEARRTRSEAPPQPRRREPATGETGEAPEPEAAPQPVHEPEPEAAPAAQPSMVTIESVEETGAPAAEAAKPPAARERVSLEEEVIKSAKADLPEVEMEEEYDESGDEDVVYGNGRISEDSSWEFVQQYPDSAVKFLYRKTLDNKNLPPSDEDIYRHWEARGLTRAKVREIILEIMGWHSLPDTFPHNIWRELRDQIFEMSGR